MNENYWQSSKAWNTGDHTLAATEIPVTVLTDHANLTFWKNPRKVNRRVARWFATTTRLQPRIKHVPGKLHKKIITDRDPRFTSHFANALCQRLKTK
jgi:hypothetical protein